MPKRKRETTNRFNWIYLGRRIGKATSWDITKDQILVRNLKLHSSIKIKSELEDGVWPIANLDTSRGILKLLNEKGLVVIYFDIVPSLQKLPAAKEDDYHE